MGFNSGFIPDLVLRNYPCQGSRGRYVILEIKSGLAMYKARVLPTILLHWSPTENLEPENALCRIKESQTVDPGQETGGPWERMRPILLSSCLSIFTCFPLLQMWVSQTQMHAWDFSWKCLPKSLLKNFSQCFIVLCPLTHLTLCWSYRLSSHSFKI